VLGPEILKWTKTISLSLTRQLTYKFDFLLTLVLPPLVLVSVSYALWAEIFDREKIKEIGGFTRDAMLRYQCWTFIAALLVREHRSWNLSEDIRFGRITAFLLYPFTLWGAYASEFIAFQIIQLFVVAVSISALCLLNLVPMIPLATLASGLALSLLIAALWFSFEFLFGLLAFWLEETWILRYVFNLLTITLSGAFIPIELFPQWLQKVLQYTPFPLLTSIPVHVFLGSNSQPTLYLSLRVLFWTALASLCARYVWRRGIRLYSASGI